MSGQRRFAAEVAAAALGGSAQAAVRGPGEVELPLPMHAREFLRRLAAAPDVDSVARGLAALLHRPVLVTRARRAAIVAACCVFPLLSIFKITGRASGPRPRETAT